jgi:hypothetical protein
MKIEIKPVKTKKDLAAFLRLPWRIYKDSPNWVPPLLSEVREILDAEKNPFWRHARREIFLAREAGRPVGRIERVFSASLSVRITRKQPGGYLMKRGNT